ALAIGMALDGSAPAAAPARASSRRRVLHVTASVHGIGGHTRTLYHWARNDAGSRHSVVLTDPGREAPPAWLADVIRERGGAPLHRAQHGAADPAAGARRAAGTGRARCGAAGARHRGRRDRDPEHRPAAQVPAMRAV